MKVFTIYFRLNCFKDVSSTAGDISRTPLFKFRMCIEFVHVSSVALPFSFFDILIKTKMYIEM